MIIPPNKVSRQGHSVRRMEIFTFVENSSLASTSMYIGLSNCLKLCVPKKKNLRSSSDCLRLDYPITRNKAGGRTFTVCASKLWNNLPKTRRNSTSVNAFKKVLKTYLFPN